MPIGGFVVTVVPEESKAASAAISAMDGAEVHGEDDRGNLVVVLESETSEAMDQMVKEIRKLDQVLSVGLVYFHAEDEVERMESGSYVPSRSFGRKVH